jgi:hypothetical protein
MDIGQEMLFETTIRAFLGQKAYHIASQAHSQKARVGSYRKVFKKIVKQVQTIDASAKHKEQLEYFSNQLYDLVKGRNFNEQIFSLYLLRFTGTLLGYLSLRGSCLATPTYFQTPSQYYTQLIFNGGDTMRDYYDEHSATGVRIRLVAQLKDEGLNDFQISLVLNVTEYEVKKLRAEL